MNVKVLNKDFAQPVGARDMCWGKTIYKRGVPIPVFFKLSMNTRTSVWVLSNTKYWYRVLPESEPKHYTMTFKNEFLLLRTSWLFFFIGYSPSVSNQIQHDIVHTVANKLKQIKLTEIIFFFKLYKFCGIFHVEPTNHIYKCKLQHIHWSADTLD